MAWLALSNPNAVTASSRSPEQGEWPRGVAPRGSLRTVREPLDSHHSHYPAVVPATRQWTNIRGVTIFILRNHCPPRCLSCARVLYLRRAHCSSLSST